MATSIIIGNVNITNDHLITKISGNYGWQGAAKVVAGSQGTEQSINLGPHPISKCSAEFVLEVKTMIGEFILEGFTVRIEEK